MLRVLVAILLRQANTNALSDPATWLTALQAAKWDAANAQNGQITGTMVNGKSVTFLWRFHHVDHRDLDWDVSTTFRFHCGEMLLSERAGVGKYYRREIFLTETHVCAVLIETIPSIGALSRRRDAEEFPIFPRAMPPLLADQPCPPDSSKTAGVPKWLLQ
jgi:hypothetical protein